jgi:hypothetical protein
MRLKTGIIIRFGVHSYEQYVYQPNGLKNGYNVNTLHAMSRDNTARNIGQMYMAAASRRVAQ